MIKNGILLSTASYENEVKNAYFWRFKIQITQNNLAIYFLVHYV